MTDEGNKRAMNLSPELDVERGLSFLRHIQPGGPWHLVAISQAGGIKARTFSSEDEEELTEWLEGCSDAANVYFHPARMRPGFADRKAKKADVLETSVLWVDVDDPKALERIRNCVPTPTAIVFSGGGFHAYWVLKEPTDELDHAERLNKVLAARLGGDSCFSIDHLLRVPGTINLPNAKKAARGRRPGLAEVVEADWSRTYGLGDFPDDGPKPAGPKGAIAETPSPPEAVEAVALSQLPVAISEETRAIVDSGDDLDRPIGTDGARFRSRSEAVFHVACALVRAGCSDEFIAGVLVNPQLGISASVREKRNVLAYAFKQARSARAACAEDWPDVDGMKRPKPTFANTVVALRRLGLTFSFDRFRNRKAVNGAQVEEYHGEVSDDVCVVIRHLIVEQFGFDPRPDNVFAAVHFLCLENQFHPILQMLESLLWDGTPRLEHWLSTYLDASDTPLNRAIGVILLVAAIRRVRQPGAKFDQIVVLEGPQGSGKSTSLKILAGPENHSDQEILTQDSKTQMELMAGVWIYELGEVEGMSRAEVNKIKAFASRSVDRSRMAYARFVETRPRQSIFVGTTNEDKYLRDQTGNRRFWPVRTGAIDLEALARDRDQLWAEAAVREAEGASIVLPRELWDAAAAEQAGRLEEDPWIDLLSPVNGVAEGEKARISTAYLLQYVLEIPPDRQNQHQTKRLAIAMKKLGWEQGKFREKDKTVRGYVRLKRPDHKDDELPGSKY
ncbi:VapE domain-containing protein [Hansschlegelia sp.]|uniref:VapE domain-containing protein n=1 Tax=Hansschlegelia sp. TaxID=2041892 RepID=UPI002C98702A|nr:VapE domain-containing protein [Hansschlegelia sp.]HVI30172.1 VapE domain-containing protein [Hansschlegelia sp.]